MTVHFIGAGPGAADLITLRGQQLIASCQVCLYAGSLVPSEILTHCPDGARIINTAPLDLDAIIEECMQATELGHDVARLHSGDLSIWSAIGEQLRRLRKAKINFTLTPGVPSFSAAASALGTELTLPSLTQSVVLTRTPGRASSMPDNESLENFARTNATLAIHLSIHNLKQVVEKLLPFYGGDCSAAIVYRESWPDQKIIRGTLQSFKGGVSEDIERTALILVGHVLGNETFAESSLYSTDYDRRFRPGSANEEKKL